MTGLPLNIDWQQIMLHLFNFVILAGGLYILLYKPVRDFMEKRERYYREMDNAAQECQDKAISLKHEYEERLEKAEEEISRMKNEAAAAAKASADRQLENATATADRIIADAKSKARAEHDRMIAGAREEVVKLAEEAAARIIDGRGDVYADFAKSITEEGADVR